MSNKPFISQNTNIFNENKYNTVPGTIGNESVLITQSSQRQVIDQKSLTITKNETQPLLYYLPTNPTQQKPLQPAVQHGQKEYFPGGIMYTFNDVNRVQGNQLMGNQPTIFNEANLQPPSFQLPSPPLSLEQMIALKQLEQQGLELTLLQERLKRNPYQLRFHETSTTSTSDLLDALNQTPTSHGLPDLNCVCGGRSKLITSLQPAKPVVLNDDLSCYSSNSKKLVLTKSPDLVKHEPTIKPNDEDSSCGSILGDEYQQDKSDSSENSEDDSENAKEKKRKRASKKEKNPKSPKENSKRRNSSKHKKQTSFEETRKHNKRDKCNKSRGTREKRNVKHRNCTTDTSSSESE